MLLLAVLISVIYFAQASELAGSAAFIANNAFDQRLPAMVIWWRSDLTVINNFLINYHGSVITLKISGSVNNSEFYEGFNFKQTVCFTSQTEKYENFLLQINRSTLNPIRVILVITSRIKEISYLESYTKLSLNNDVSDIIIVNKNYDKNVTISTYMPYGPTGCGNYKPVALQTDDRNLFPQKFKNFYGCPIRIIAISVVPYSMFNNNESMEIVGIDVDFMNVVFEKLNSSTHIFLSPNGGPQILKRLEEGSFDMSLPSKIVNLDRYQNAQVSNVFSTMDIVLCAPNQREIYAWAKVLVPFFTNTTPLIILSFLMFVGNIALIQRFGRFRRNAPRGIVFGTLGLFLGQDMKFETKYWLNNAIFMVWIWYCTIVRVAYQGDLVEGLHKTFLEPHLKTYTQALDSVEEYGGIEVFLRTFSLNSSIHKKSTIVPWKHTPEYIEEISKGRRFLLITEILMIQRSPYEVQVVDERLSNFPKVFFMRPRWGGAKELNRRMIQVFEAGLMNKFIDDYLGNSIKVRRHKSARTIEALTMTTVASCFFGLLTLGFLWTIVLCLEIVWYNINIKNKIT